MWLLKFDVQFSSEVSTRCPFGHESENLQAPWIGRPRSTHDVGRGGTRLAVAGASRFQIVEGRRAGPIRPLRLSVPQSGPSVRGSLCVPSVPGNMRGGHRELESSRLWGTPPVTGPTDSLTAMSRAGPGVLYARRRFRLVGRRTCTATPVLSRLRRRLVSPAHGRGWSMRADGIHRDAGALFDEVCCRVDLAVVGRSYDQEVEVVGWHAQADILAALLLHPDREQTITDLSRRAADHRGIRPTHQSGETRDGPPRRSRARGRPSIDRLVHTESHGVSSRSGCQRRLADLRGHRDHCGTTFDRGDGSHQ
jgi:hypothetical protein